MSDDGSSPLADGAGGGDVAAEPAPMPPAPEPAVVAPIADSPVPNSRTTPARSSPRNTSPAQAPSPMSPELRRREEALVGVDSIKAALEFLFTRETARAVPEAPKEPQLALSVFDEFKYKVKAQFAELQEELNSVDTLAHGKPSVDAVTKMVQQAENSSYKKHSSMFVKLADELKSVSGTIFKVQNKCELVQQQALDCKSALDTHAAKAALTVDVEGKVSELSQRMDDRDRADVEAREKSDESLRDLVQVQADRINTLEIIIKGIQEQQVASRALASTQHPRGGIPAPGSPATSTAGSTAAAAASEQDDTAVADAASQKQFDELKAKIEQDIQEVKTMVDGKANHEDVERAQKTISSLSRRLIDVEAITGDSAEEGGSVASRNAAALATAKRHTKAIDTLDKTFKQLEMEVAFLKATTGIGAAPQSRSGNSSGGGDPADSPSGTSGATPPPPPRADSPGSGRVGKSPRKASAVHRSLSTATTARAFMLDSNDKMKHFTEQMAGLRAFVQGEVQKIGQRVDTIETEKLNTSMAELDRISEQSGTSHRMMLTQRERLDKNDVAMKDIEDKIETLMAKRTDDLLGALSAKQFKQSLLDRRSGGGGSNNNIAASSGVTNLDPSGGSAPLGNLPGIFSPMDPSGGFNLNKDGPNSQNNDHHSDITPASLVSGSRASTAGSGMRPGPSVASMGSLSEHEQMVMQEEIQRMADAESVLQQVPSPPNRNLDGQDTEISGGMRSSSGLLTAGSPASPKNVVGTSLLSGDAGKRIREHARKLEATQLLISMLKERMGRKVEQRDFAMLKIALEPAVAVAERCAHGMRGSSKTSLQGVLQDILERLVAIEDHRAMQENIMMEGGGSYMSGHGIGSSGGSGGGGGHGSMVAAETIRALGEIRTLSERQVLQSKRQVLLNDALVALKRQLMVALNDKASKVELKRILKHTESLRPPNLSESKPRQHSPERPLMLEPNAIGMPSLSGRSLHFKCLSCNRMANSLPTNHSSTHPNGVMLFDASGHDSMLGGTIEASCTCAEVPPIRHNADGSPIAEPTNNNDNNGGGGSSNMPRPPDGSKLDGGGSGPQGLKVTVSRPSTRGNDNGRSSKSPTSRGGSSTSRGRLESSPSDKVMDKVLGRGGMTGWGGVVEKDGLQVSPTLPLHPAGPSSGGLSESRDRDGRPRTTGKGLRSSHSNKQAFPDIAPISLEFKMSEGRPSTRAGDGHVH